MLLNRAHIKESIQTLKDTVIVIANTVARYQHAKSIQAEGAALTEKAGANAIEEGAQVSSNLAAGEGAKTFSTFASALKFLGPYLGYIAVGVVALTAII